MFPRIVLGCVVLSTLSLATSAEEPKETKLKPTLIFSGTHSAIQYETFDLISTEVGWKELWKKHRGEESDPLFTETDQEFAVDFETHYVVLVFTGGGDWCKITPRMRGNVVVLGFRGEVYQTELGAIFGPDDPLPRTPDAKTIHLNAKKEVLAPYTFVVLPKPVKTVVIEENVQRQLGEPPVWKFRFLFPAPKGVK